MVIKYITIILNFLHWWVSNKTKSAAEFGIRPTCLTVGTTVARCTRAGVFIDSISAGAAILTGRACTIINI